MESAAAEARYPGGCLCGAVRYLARGAPVNQRVCHCRLCQKAIGAAFNARLLFRAEQVEVTGSPARFNSSPELEREFCARCGTTLFSSRSSTGLTGITAGSLDDPGQFRPATHLWTAARQPWLVLDDGLPAHPGAAPPDRA